MAHDRSRSTFDPRRPTHYSGVLAQQGRVITDDDWNDADAIAHEDERRSRVEIIGPAGTSDDGFQITNPRLVGNEIDFDLKPGSMYVGGLRATSEVTETFRLQKDWLQQSDADRATLGGGDRIDLVYLEAWQQPVSAVEDSELLEVALGGPDTTVRNRVMRRTKVLPNVGTTDCELAWQKLVSVIGTLDDNNELVSDARLAVGYLPNNVPAADLCSPTVQSGYLGAENQLIRIEIGSTPGSLLWGFDNASPLYRVQVKTNAQGAQVVHFLQQPKDEAHWPLAGQVIEILPWSAVLPNNEKVAEVTGGHLAKVSASYDPDSQDVEVTPAVAATFDNNWRNRADANSISSVADSYFFARVWDRSSDTASAPEIGFTPGTALELKDTGISVTLTGTTFRPGDFWTIAVRPESPAQVVPWSLESGKATEGIRRFFAPLGTIQWRPTGAAPTATDCRKTFVPLTEHVEEADCCVCVHPEPGWQRVIENVADRTDLCLCFAPGDFETDTTIEFRNANVRVHGAGGASRIHGTGIERVLQFSKCTTAQVENLVVSSSGIIPYRDLGNPQLGGVLTTLDCERVIISNVTARCMPGTTKSASCITVYSSPDAAKATPATVSVRDCDLAIGTGQVGLLVINAQRSTIAGNAVHANAITNLDIEPGWLQQRPYRRVLRDALFWRFGLLDQQERPPIGAVRVNFGDYSAWLEAPQALASQWPRATQLRVFPPGRYDHASVGQFLHELAEDLIYNRGSIGERELPAFRRYIDELLALRSPYSALRGIGAQGIVVGGTVAGDVRIMDNVVTDVVQGIHVGVSAKRPRNPGAEAPASDTAGRVSISDNSVFVTLMPEAIQERHGIFVGSTTSLVIERNHLECGRVGDASRLKVEGIRVYGFLGSMAYLSKNDLSGFTTGVRFAALNNLQVGQSSMWRVIDNIAIGATFTVDNSLSNGSTSYLVSSGNLP